ncbi:MAG: hypothetical protein HY319_24170 [Armatimonadetes bacterium]|nr:hypothetical protein [Armatimonadota bacterium]
MFDRLATELDLHLLTGRTSEEFLARLSRPPEKGGQLLVALQGDVEQRIRTHLAQAQAEATQTRIAELDALHPDAKLRKMFVAQAGSCKKCLRHDGQHYGVQCNISLVYGYLDWDESQLTGLLRQSVLASFTRLDGLLWDIIGTRVAASQDQGPGQHQTRHETSGSQHKRRLSTQGSVEGARSDAWWG